MISKVTSSSLWTSFEKQMSQIEKIKQAIMADPQNASAIPRQEYQASFAAQRLPVSSISEAEAHWTQNSKRTLLEGIRRYLDNLRVAERIWRMKIRFIVIFTRHAYGFLLRSWKNRVTLPITGCRKWHPKLLKGVPGGQLHS